MNIENDAQAVYGLRDLSGRSQLLRLGNQSVILATNVLYGCRLNDMKTYYRLIKRVLFQSPDLRSKRFEIQAEILETPNRYEPREEGTELTPWDGTST